MARMAILMLCHRIPYPADKGDKIRNLHLLRALQQVADVSLGCFVDTAFDLQYQQQLAAEVSELFCIYRSPTMGLCHVAAALLRDHAATSAWYADRRMRHWVDQKLKQTDRVVVSSSAMVQYCLNRPLPQPTVFDLVDVDSDKWHQYAKRAAWYKRWLYQREAKLICQLEATAAIHFDQLTLVSSSEAECFKKLHPTVIPDKVHGISNGVDCSYFDPAPFLQSFPVVSGSVLFTGEMNYKPNVEAVLWFVATVWPLIQQQIPHASFVIVGRNPVAAITALHGKHNIRVTGRVPDVRPWLASAALVIAPMLLARGIKNKVLEALAMAKPLVATPEAMLGLQQVPQSTALQICTGADQFAAACTQQLLQKHAYIETHRQYVQAFFSWQRTLAPLLSMLKLEGSKTS